MKKYILTGGLGVGKTTILKILESRGYPVIYEISNLLINEYQKRHGVGKFPWENGLRLKFQKEVLKKQIQKEKNIENTGNELVFLDRGVIDGIPFFLLNNIEVPKDLLEIISINKYDKVFFIESLPNKLYKKDTHRPQDLEISKKIEKILLENYIKFGYSLIKVPVLTPQERVNFILKNVNLL